MGRHVRYRIAFFLSVVLLSASVAFSGDSGPPEILWFKRFGPGEASAFSVREVVGSGIVVAGVWGPSGQRGAYLRRVGPSGNMLWDVVLDVEGEAIANAVDVSSEGFILAGKTGLCTTGGACAYLALVSHAGEVVWEKRITSRSILAEGRHSTTATAVTGGRDGGFAFLAEVALVDPPGETTVYVGKTDARGELEWERMVSEGGMGRAWCIRQTQDGDYIAVSTRTGSEGSLFLTKLSPTGGVVWQQVYSERMSKLSLQELFGGFVLAGETANGIRVLRTDLKGDVVGQADFNRNGEFSANAGARRLADADYVTAVTARIVEGQTSVVLSKFDESGALSWETVFGEDYTTIHAFEVISDGGYVATGIVSSMSRRADIFVARLSPTGVGRFVRGDSNDDARANLADAVFSLNRLFGGGEEPECLQAADVDDDGEFKLTDAVFLLQHLFQSGPQPPAPFDDCGIDNTLDGLICTGAKSCGF